MNGLPDQWCLARVRDLVELNPRNDCPDELDVGFVPLARLGTRYRSHHTFETKKWADVKNGYTHFADGDVLLARITPSFENGKAAIARGLPNGLGAGSTEFIVCRPSAGGILAEYLLAYFKTHKFLQDGANVMSGAVGHQRVPKKFVLDRLIPLPPVTEQKRIVVKLNSILAQVDTCREHLDSVLLILKRFRRSVLASAASGDLTEDWREATHVESDGSELLDIARTSHLQFAADLHNGSNNPPAGGLRRRRRYRIPDRVDRSYVSKLPDSWTWATGGELVEPGDEIVYGIVQPGPKLAVGVPYIRGTDIQDGQILEHQLLRTSTEVAKRHSRSSLRGGDVLLGIIRSTKVAIVPDSLTGTNITQGTARFRPSKVIRSKYLAIALESPLVQLWFHERYRGIDMPGLNLADVRRVPLPLPPIEEQDAIIGRVDNLFSVTRGVLTAHSVAHECLNTLPSSLFNKTFLGQLVPQDATDEHASQLLERTLALRDSKPRTRPARSTTRRVTMAQITPDSVKQAILEMPGHRFTFQQLRERLPGDYEALRDSLFLLLGDSEPMLRQVFDGKAKKMVLQRIQK